MSELEIHMKMLQKQSKEEAVLQVINYLKYNPGYFEYLKQTLPFSHPKLKDVDWTKVKEASINEGTLKIEF